MKTRNILGQALVIFACALMPLCAEAALPVVELVTTFSSPDEDAYTRAWGINSRGEIAGNFEFTRGQVVEEGFVRSRTGDFTIIQLPNQMGPRTVALAINDSGVVGGYYVMQNYFHGFILADGTYTTFDLPQMRSTYVSALNDSGDFAGYGYDGLGGGRGFINTSGNVTYVDIPGSTFAYVQGMNNLGQVVGAYYLDGSGTHGFFRDADGTLTYPIDYPGASVTSVYDINDKGWMVGIYIGSDDHDHGFFLDSSMRFVVFDAPGAIATALHGINNRGIISGDYSVDLATVNGLVARVHKSTSD